MMDYTQLGNAYQAQIARPVPELGRIKAAVGRIAKARSNIECFVGSFNGGAACLGGGECSTPETDSYRHDIDALFEQIDRLESVIEALASIG
jgi:hypothetical protein